MEPKFYIIFFIFFLFCSQDIHECLTDKDNCHSDANCTNTKGSFYCTCHTGYSGDGVTCVGKAMTRLHCQNNLGARSSISCSKSVENE